ncbi:MAG: hypothetical protein JXA75_07000 [Candidatus Thermoplasmatota archaeon]|nr:hypothetical protein [Candidatus Thermoplasmatota archaeon]
MGKISNKKLSHNLKTRKAPLRVLPMTPLHMRHQNKVKKNMKTTLSQPPIQCTIDTVSHITGKRAKKSTRNKTMTIKPFWRLHFTLDSFRWIFFLIFVYIAAGVAIVIFQDGTDSLKNIVVYSIIGFFTFFMGYLGWILARDFLEVVSGKKIFRNKAELDA